MSLHIHCFSLKVNVISVPEYGNPLKSPLTGQINRTSAGKDVVSVDGKWSPKHSTDSMDEHALLRGDFPAGWRRELMWELW